MATAIEFNQISKLYRLGTVSTGTLAHDLRRWWTVNILRHEDPYLKVGEVNDRSTRGQSDYVWALRNIDFKVEQGDVVGIIGRNGAGKSTLLKILSRITAPTQGTIKARGRIGSLLELGTGFHPEMTGRENIYLNGAILGMTKAEISRKLDEIIDFSGCERYIDTPVKRYSSGMLVRLGFAVAAHLDPEILVVDEVLAVGDAEFQKKAIGKMQDASRTEGRTVLFVSHNISAVRKLCHHCVLLENGEVQVAGNTEYCISKYLQATAADVVGHCLLKPSDHIIAPSFTKEIEILEARLLNNPKECATDEPIQIELLLKRNFGRHKECQYSVFVYDSSGHRVETFYTMPMPIPEHKDTYHVRLTLKRHNLYGGRYYLRFAVGEKDFSTTVTNYDASNSILSFDVKYINKQQGTIYNVEATWLTGIYFTGDDIIADVENV